MKIKTIFFIILAFTGFPISQSMEAETRVSSKNKLEVLEDSLNQILDTMPRGDAYFKTISSLERMLMHSPRFIFYAEKKEAVARELNKMNYVCESYCDRATYYNNIGQTDSFYYFKNLMDPLALSLKEYDYYFYIGQMEVGAYIKKGKIEKAIQTAKKLYETAKTHQSNEGLVASNMSIGMAMKNAKRKEEAYDSFEKALEIMKEKGINKNGWLFNNYSYLIILCEQLGRYAQGLEYVYQKENLIEKIRNESVGIQNDKTYMLDEWCELQLRKASFNIMLGNLEKAKKQLQNIYSYYPDISQSIQMQYHYATFEYYQAMGKYPEALSEFNIAFDYYNGLTPEVTIQIMEDKAKLLGQNGALQESVKLYQDLLLLKDSMNNKRFDAQVGELRAIYDTDHLKLQNSELELRNKHIQLRAIFATLILSILALAFITLLYIHNYRIKKKLEHSEEQLKEEKEALKIAKEKAEEARDLAQKAERKESFFANMSHEIRTPLNAIVGFSNLLATEEDVSDEERVLFIKMINQNSEQLLKLINDVLDLSRMESDKMLFAFEDQDMTELIEETYSTSQMIIPKHLAFTKSYPDTSVRVHIDKMRTKQVLFNFINNAVKFTEKGIIHIGYKVDKEEKTVSIFVKDTGRGIPVEHQKKIFERFYKQVDTDQGTGLGLSICTIIAEKLGGRITLVSEVGKGSCFSIVLPYDETIN